jgi:hypothetical protein
MTDLLAGALIAGGATLIAAIAGWGGQVIAGRTQRSQWLVQTRQAAYFEFYNSWESAFNLVKADASGDDIDNAFDSMFVAARGIDLLGAVRTRNAAWIAVQRLQDFRAGDCSAVDLRSQINSSLNVFKRDIGVTPSNHL